MNFIYKSLKFLVWFLMIAGVVVGIVAKCAFLETTNETIQFFSTILAVGFVLLFLMAASLLAVVKLFLKTLEEYFEDDF